MTASSSTSEAAPLLSYEHVTVCYDGVAVVRDVSLSLGAGETLGLVGESGSGKSTLARAAMGLLGPGGAIESGSIWYACEDGTVDLARLSPGQHRVLAGTHIGMVFQDSLAALTPTRRVADQLVEARAAHGMGSRSEALDRGRVLLGRLNVPPDLADRVLASYPFELSGGLGQRVGIMMALALEPEVLFADEPTSALDVISQRHVVDELAQLVREAGIGMVLVSHNMGVVRVLADTVLVLRDGHAEEQGPAAQVLGNPHSAYTRRLLAAVPRLRTWEGDDGDGAR